LSTALKQGPFPADSRDMRFIDTPIPGVHLIELEPRGDERGFFARAFCTDELTRHGLVGHVAQANNSFSVDRGTLRGMHYQLPPASEVKIVRCIRGSLWDVVLDVRAGSPTFGQWYGAELSAENRLAMYAPAGFAHGFLTLEPDTEAFYLASHAYAPEQERGIRWNDPRFTIQWPIEPTVVSEKDQSHRDFDPAWHLGDARAAA
jgi:dTDP-4-dehydrorhamnose 3,5-epimerase